MATVKLYKLNSRCAARSHHNDEVFKYLIKQEKKNPESTLKGVFNHTIKPILIE